MDKIRDNSFDALKGILILLVVLGHAYQYQYQCWRQPLFNFIYSFHMPLFIMVSGYFFSTTTKKTFSQVLKNKTQRLLVPWFVWSSILLLIFFASQTFAEGLHTPLVIFLDIVNVYLAIWYLPCIFLLSCLYYFLFWIRHRRGVMCVLILFITFYILLVLFISKDYNNMASTPVKALCLGLTLFFNGTQVVRHILSFGIGVLFSLYCQKLNLLSRCCVVLLAVFVIILNRLIFGFWIIDYSEYIRISDGISCGILAYVLLMPFCRYVSRTKWGHFLTFLGRNSLGIYVIHMVFTNILKWYPVLGHFPNNAECFYLFLGFMVATLFIQKLLNTIFKSKTYILGL